MPDSFHTYIKNNQRDDRRISYHAEIDSTNTKAAQLIQKGAAAGTVVVAETQTEGRGRLQRFWQSPPGTGLYFSLIWHSHLPPEDLAIISLAVGLGLCKAVEEETGLAPQLKWPNDLLLSGRKVGGILIENQGGAGEGSAVVIGIGLNVNTTRQGFPLELAEKASSLALCTQRAFSRGLLFFAVLRSVEKELLRLEEGEKRAVLAEFRMRDATYGKTMDWLTPNRQVVTGTSLGINEQGLLQVRDLNGTIHKVLSGDVNLRGQKPEDR